MFERTKNFPLFDNNSNQSRNRLCSPAISSSLPNYGKNICKMSIFKNTQRDNSFRIKGKSSDEMIIDNIQLKSII